MLFLDVINRPQEDVPDILQAQLARLTFNLVLRSLRDQQPNALASLASCPSSGLVSSALMRLDLDHSLPGPVP